MRILKLASIAILLLSLLGLAPANAQLVPQGPESVVVSGSAAGLECPRVAARENGSFVVVWPEGESLKAQRFDGAGVASGGEIDVDMGRLAGRALVDLTVQSRPGGEIVVWSSVVPGRSATTLRFYARVLAEPALARINVPSYVTKLFPRPTGGYLAAWQTKTSAWAVALLNDAGRPVSPTLRATTIPAASFFDATPAPDGSFGVYWYSASFAFSRLLLRRFGPNLHPLGLSQTVEDTRTPSANREATAPDGRSVVAWSDYETPPSGLTGTIRIRFFVPDGSPASEPFAVARPPNPPVTGFNPDALAVDRLGRAALVWSLLDFDPPTDSHEIQLWTPGGAAGPPLDLGAFPIKTGRPFCADAAAAGSTFFVVWRSLNAAGTETIYVRRFAAL